MGRGIVVMDYSSDWALKERAVEPKTSAGFLTREEVVAFYGSLEIDGIELLHAYWEDCSPAYLRRLAEDAGKPIVTYIFSRDLAQPPSGRRSAVEEVRALLDRTAELGASLAMLHPALAKDGFSLAEQRAWLIEGLRACAEHAESTGVTLVAENIDDPAMRPLLGRGSDCRDVCAAVDSPAFRLIYDCAAPLFVEEDPLETLRVMLPYVAHVHVKNSRPVSPGEYVERSRRSIGGRPYTGTRLDGGIVNLAAILEELARHGYDGYLSIEYQGEDDPRPALQHNVAYLQRLRQATL